MDTPSPPSPPATKPRRKVLRWLLILAAVPCLLVVRSFLFHFFRAPEASGDPATFANEARVNVLRLCDDVQSYRNEHGTFPAAGPLPKEVPQGGRAVPFPHDETFEKLGFAPGEHVRYQYQVVVQETPLGEAEVTCFARGDLDGDGQVSVFRVTLDANGMTSPVQVEREEE
jgi:hypothetical protein